MAVTKPAIGTRFIHSSRGLATVIPADHCEVLKKHGHQTQEWRDEYIWFKFDDGGGINGWVNLIWFTPTVTPLEQKVEEARAALAAAEAALEAAKLPKPGDRYSSAFNNTTATVKFVEGDAVYYEIIGNYNQVVSHAGRKVESFLKAYETKLGDCECP